MANTLTAAVLADVHGNYLALKACLSYAKKRGVKHYLFLGDYITDHAFPQRVMEQLYEMEREYDCRFIRGNREEYMIDYRGNGARQPDGAVWAEGSAQGALLHCYENLTPKDIDWFEKMPIYDEWRPEGAPPVSLCHGSPQRVRGAMRGEPDFFKELPQLGPDLLLKGHNHKHFCLAYQGKRVVCAGSVGNPIARRARLGKPEATELAKSAQMLFLRLEKGCWALEYVKVPYNWQGAIENLEISGLSRRAPVWAAMLRYNVLTGCDPFMVVPSRAAELYHEASGITALWHQVPEPYWRQAAEEFGVPMFR